MSAKADRARLDKAAKSLMNEGFRELMQTCLLCYRKSSSMKTAVQQVTATLKRSNPNHATMMPTRKDIAPDILLCVAFMIAGNVITARVTYGT